MEYRDYYGVLGLKRSATPDEIKQAYRRLARKYHPDVNSAPDAEARFKEVGEAYAVLKDPEKRAAYDGLGAGFSDHQPFQPPPGWDREFAAGAKGFSDQDGSFSDFFDTLFGSQAFQARSRRADGFKGADEQARVGITLEEAYRQDSVLLSVLGADGRDRQLKIRIPAGIADGHRVRLRGQGGPGVGGGPAGDLYVEFRLVPHPRFKADGRDIHYELPVTPWEAALGAELEVATLGGRVKLRIPPGSQAGNRLRLKGRGLPGDPPGDQYVTLRVVLPSADSQAARALYQQMATELAFDPREAP